MRPHFYDEGDDHEFLTSHPDFECPLAFDQGTQEDREPFQNAGFFTFLLLEYGK